MTRIERMTKDLFLMGERIGKASGVIILFKICANPPNPRCPRSTYAVTDGKRKHLYRLPKNLATASMLEFTCNFW